MTFMACISFAIMLAFVFATYSAAERIDFTPIWLNSMAAVMAGVAGILLLAAAS